jgi:phosphatidate phosphatase PAH1
VSDVSPFYAGFGNRPTDVVAYTAVGVPRGKIFIIDPRCVMLWSCSFDLNILTTLLPCRGDVRMSNRTLVESYETLCDLVDTAFPPVRKVRSESICAQVFLSLLACRMKTVMTHSIIFK